MSDHTPAPIEAFWAGYRQQLGEPTDVEVVDFTTPDMRLCLGQVTVPTCSKPKRTWS
jgi:hypothetical protein